MNVSHAEAAKLGFGATDLYSTLCSGDTRAYAPIVIAQPYELSNNLS